MFYSQHVLTRSGPLAKVWIAAHVESKLTKVMVFSVDIEKAIEEILNSEIPMALRLSSSLLLGVARIFKRKTIYLFQDSSEAITRLKFSYKPTPVISAAERRAHKAKNAAITISGKENAQPPNIDLSLVPLRDKNGPSPAYLASDRDITIDQFADRLAGEVLELFSANPEIERADSEQPEKDDAEELLVFTPSQVPSEEQSASPAMSGRGPPSIELMREPEAPQPMTVDVSPEITPAEPPVTEGPEAGEIPIIEPESPEETPILSQERAESEQGPSPPEGEAQPTTIPRLSTGGDELELAEGTPVAVTPVQPTEGETPTAEAPPQEPESMEIEPTPEVAEETVPPSEITAAPGDMDVEPTETEPIQPAPETTPTAPEEVPVGSDDEAQEEPSQIQAAAPEEPEEAQGEPQPTPAPTEAQEEEREPERQRARPRKRKATVLMDEGPTELPTRRFRNMLVNTSDLVHPSQVERPLEPTAQRQRYEGLLSRPVVELAAPLNEFFAESFRLPEILVSSPMTDVDLAGDQAAVVPEQEGEPRKETGEEAEVAPSQPEFGAEAIEMEPIEPAEVIPEEAREAETEEEVAKETSPARREVEVVADPGVIPPVDEESAPVSGEVGSLPEMASFGDMAVPTTEEIEGRVEAEAPQDPEVEMPSAEFEGVLTLRSVADMKTHVSFEQAHQEVTLATLSERTQQMHKLISENIVDGRFEYSEKVRMESAGRRSVARTFYELLCLGSKKALSLSQDGAYGDILVTPLQPTFDSLRTSSEQRQEIGGTAEG